MRNLAGRLLFIAVVIATASLGPSPVAAGQANEAFQHVHALGFDADGRALWLAAHTGLYRSEDRGQNWTRAPLPGQGHGPDVMVIAPHPTDARIVYAGTHEAGVFKTTDGGKTWAAVNTGLAGPDVHGLAIEPNRPAKLHALVREKGDGLYRTIDGGQQWVRVDDGPAGETKVLASVNIPTGMGGIFLYAGTADGLQRSADCF